MQVTRPSWLRPALAGLAIGLLAGSPAQAALLTLGNIPLFLGTSSEPNIFFVIDDSGSMDWEIMSRDFANDGRLTGTQPNGSSPSGSGAVKHRDANESGSANCTFSSGTFYGYMYGVEFASNTYGDDGNDCNTADDENWRFRNSDFNPLYFNPTATYLPWSGRDAEGNPFGNVDVTDAPDDPYLAASQQRRIDLTRHNSNWAGTSTTAPPAIATATGSPTASATTRGWTSTGTATSTTARRPST